MNTEDRNEMLQVISDLSKEAYGFRVRKDYAAMTDAELQDQWNRFFDAAADRQDQETSREELAYDKWISHVTSLARINSVSLATAIRWDMDAEGAHDARGIDYYCYLAGIDYDRVQEIQNYFDADTK